jgi:hypothetical protein
MAIQNLQDLNLRDESLPSLGWSTYDELEQLERAALRICLDDDPAFACFCGVLRDWNLGCRWTPWSGR